MEERRKIIPVFVITVLLALGILWMMMSVQPYLIEHNHYIKSFTEIAEGTGKGNPLDFFRWYIGEFAEPQVFRIIPAAVLSCITAFIGYYLERKNSRFRGSDAVGGSGLFIPVFFLNITSLLLCDLLYAKDARYGFMPTFIAMACVVVPLVMTYGYNIPKFFTIMIITGTIPYLAARYAVFWIMDPLNLPRPIGGWVGMVVGTMAGAVICKHLPWMTPLPDEQNKPSPQRGEMKDWHLFIERVLADPSELICWGSSWNSIGMYIGGFIGWFLNPYSSSCLEGRVPVIMMTQVVTVAISNFVFFPMIRKKEAAYTFTGYVPISCFINYYTDSPFLIFLSILASAILAPAMTIWIDRHIKWFRKWPLAVMCITSMILFTSGWSFLLQFLTS